MLNKANIIKCRYCSWTTMRFRGRGKNYGERKLRVHVLDYHKEEYLRAQGLEGESDDRPWTLDTEDIGERAL